MVVFNVYEPPTVARDRLDRAAELVFVRDGFSWLAAIVPALWFLVKSLWLELLVFLGLAAAITWSVEAAGAFGELSGMVLIIIQIVLGFEAGALQGAVLERRGWRLVGTVTGHNQDDCERRFFETWQPGEPATIREDSGASWATVMLRNAKDSLARGRRRIGAKA